MNNVVVTCPNCSTKNRVPAIRQHQRPKCGHCRTPLAMAAVAVVVELTDQELAAALRDAELPLLLDFYSPTCGPCRMLAPVLDRLATAFLGRIIIAKINTATNPHSATRFDIRGVPTLLCFKNGQVVDQMVGAMPEDVLLARLNALLTS